MQIYIDHHKYRDLIKQIDSMLLWVCKVIDHKDKVVKTSVTHLPVPWVPLSCSYCISMSSVMSFDLLLNKHTATWNLFVNYKAYRSYTMLIQELKHDIFIHKTLDCVDLLVLFLKSFQWLSAPVNS